MYIYIYMYGNVSIKMSTARYRWRNGQTVGYFEGLSNLKSSTRNNTAFVGVLFSDFNDKTSEVDLSRYVQTLFLHNMQVFL